MGGAGNDGGDQGWAMSRGRIAVLVSNDLSFDQRVRKTCSSLQKAGFEPVLIGRRMARSDANRIDRPYSTRRMWLSLNSGPGFYLLLQRGLWRELNRCHAEGELKAIWANDLDTLWPAIRGGKKWGLDVAYDSHEWFTEAEGLKGNPIRKRIWERWEQRCFRHLRRMLTVNEAIASAYREKGLDVEVVPNVPETQAQAKPMPRIELAWPEKKTMLLMQGAFMDKDRGALDAVRALVHLPEVHLALIGSGPEWNAASVVASDLGVRDRLHLHDRMPFDRLRRCTAAADIGLSLDRPTVDNFRFSLPNKLFDYVHAGLPVVCTDLPVAGRFVQEEKLGAVVEATNEGDRSIKTAEAVQVVMRAMPDPEHLAEVASRYHWEVHAHKLCAAIHALR